MNEQELDREVNRIMALATVMTEQGYFESSPADSDEDAIIISESGHDAIIVLMAMLTLEQMMEVVAHAVLASAAVDGGKLVENPWMKDKEEKRWMPGVDVFRGLS